MPVHIKSSELKLNKRHKKFWQLHDYSAFTGTTTIKDNKNSYSFIKLDGTELKRDTLIMLFHSLLAGGNGESTAEAIRAFPLKKFNNLEQAMQLINFQFTDIEKSYYIDIVWALEDNYSLSYTVTFKDSDDEFLFLEAWKDRNEWVVMDNTRSVFDVYK